MRTGGARLLLLGLSDSFAAAWPAFAAEAGLELVPVSDAGTLAGALAQATVAARPAATLIAAGGAEREVEPLLRDLVGGTQPIAVVGADPDRRLVADLVRAGAADYFVLPEDQELLRGWLRERAERATAGQRRSAFAEGESAKYRFDGILGGCPPLLAALDQAARVIPHPHVTILITGETGTGKELLARAIHYNGPRREAPFVDVNCAAIPEQLLESELFGHEKGAFTDASSAKPGLFEEAHGGTLFLDEIGHLPLALQGKILRALEERRIRRVGGTRSLPIDVRVLAATHVNLAAAVRRGEFREDLYYRLNVVPIQLPPLRARRDDIVPLARHFLAKFAAEYGVRRTLTAGAQRALRQRDWPGNVRELRNVIERAVVLAPRAELDAEDFAAAESSGRRDGERIPFPAPLSEIVQTAVTQMLEFCGGNKSEAARRLHISRTRLLRVLDGGADDNADGAEP